MNKIEAWKLIVTKIEGWYIVLIKQLPNITVALLVILLFWFMSMLFSSTSKRIFRHVSRTNKALEGLILGLFRVAIICLGIIMALGIMGLDKTVFSLLAGIGVAGLALGFALKDLVSNLVSGVTIAATSPIRIGDLIKIDEFTGFVDKVNMRDTVIRNLDGQMVRIPNQNFMTSSIINFSTLGRRRVTIEFGVSYDDSVKDIKNMIFEHLKSEKSILKDPEPLFEYVNFGGSSVNVVLKFWIRYPGEDIGRVKSLVMDFISTKAQKGSFEIPYPIRTLKIPNIINANNKINNL